MRDPIRCVVRVAIAIAAAGGVGAALVAAREAGAAAPADLVHMQIVAHEDDDFLFMNPDLGNQIMAGYGTVTVYITAGQAAGTLAGATPVLTRAQFAAARQRGVRAVYAQMAVVSNQWTRSLVAPDGVHVVELYTLDAAPHIRLIFMNLPDGGDPQEPHLNALADMWEDPGYVTDTIVPECFVFEGCSEVCSVQPVPLQYYDRAAVLSVLQALVTSYDPIFVRTLDPQPFQSSAVQPDATDHTAAARFADAVLAGHHGPEGSRRYTVTHYKGYSFLDYPQNLGFADYSEKSTTAAEYDPCDPNYAAAAYDAWYWAMWERYPASTTWLERAGDGRLVAVTVEDRRVLLWHESAPGGVWNGPVFFAGDTPLAPHLTLLKRPDGLLQLFALRLPLEREHWYLGPGPPLQEVITAIQLPSTGAIRFDPWSVVGSPDGGQFIGVQAAAIDGTGRTFVFAKDSSGAVSYAHSSGAAWSGWTSFAAQDIVDGIAAITRDDGRIEVFATARGGQIQHFLQHSNATTFDANDFAASFGGAASAPTVTKNQDGRPEIFYREAGSGGVLSVYQTPGGLWAGPVILYGDSGVGPVAAIRRDITGHIMLFERNVWSGISATWQVAPNDVFYPQWQILGGYLNEYPAATTDAFGRVVVAVKGGDGRLYLRREAFAAPIGSFEPWALIAAPCSDGVGNDADGLIDYPADPGCRHGDFASESPECNDGIDNDLDGAIDLLDSQCVAASDRSERADCANGVDDDADGLVDTADPGCRDAAWPYEDPQCSDRVDNDADGLVDWDGGGLGASDPQCGGPDGLREFTLPTPVPGFPAWWLLPSSAALLGALGARRLRWGRRAASRVLRGSAHASHPAAARLR